HANDLALLLAEFRNRVDPMPLRKGKADRDFIDDALVKDLLEIIDASEELIGPQAVRVAVVVIKEPQDMESECSMRFELLGKGASTIAGSNDHDVTCVVAPLAQALERAPKSAPRGDRCQRLGRKQRDEKKAADVRKPHDKEH